MLTASSQSPTASDSVDSRARDRVLQFVRAVLLANMNERSKANSEIDSFLGFDQFDQLAAREIVPFPIKCPDRVPRRHIVLLSCARIPRSSSHFARLLRVYQTFRPSRTVGKLCR